MYNAFSSPNIINTTFSGNSASINGGGMMSYAGSGPPASPWILNSILWGDTPNEIVRSGLATTSATYSDIQGGFTGTGNINSDPLFVNPGLGNFHIPSTSPCKDTGTSTGAPPADLEGYPRPYNGLFDMGAYEYHP
jgi:hypothetical protein